MGKKKARKTKAGAPPTKGKPKAGAAPAKMSIKRMLIITAIMLAAIFGIFYFVDFSTPDEQARPATSGRKPFPVMPANETVPVAFEDFVGAEACASCHSGIYDTWKKSTHGQAGGSPKDVKILGEFDGKPRRFKDAVLTPYRAENGDYMFNLKTDDLPEQTYRVDEVVGGGHMIGGGTQTYFTYFPDGTLRMLPFDFVRDEKVWFGETSKGQGWVPITPDRVIDKESEWFPSRLLGTHLDRQNCQECHGSQIEAKFALDKKIYTTRFNTLAINCESCHGPGKEHLRIVSGPDWKEKPSLGLKPLDTFDKDGSLGVCFKCHSLKNVLQPGYLPGDDLEEYYAVKFPILGFRKENPYYPDGRVNGFAYQLNHLASDCYINGSMTCVSCHDPHGQTYRDTNGQVLASPFDNGQCTSCHASKAIDPTAHSFHKIGSEGNQCVSCHMPYLQHQAMGKNLRFARSDHTIPIPRPAFDAALGIEGACIQCHGDKSVEFLQDKVNEWYGEVKPHNDMVGRLLKFDPSMSLYEAGEVLLPDSTNHVLGQMAGLSEFAFGYLKPEMKDIDEASINRIKNYIESNDIDVQSVAMAGLHLARDGDDEVHNLLVGKLEEMEEGRRRKVMKRWSAALPIMAKKFEQQGDYKDAIETYRKSLEIMPHNIGVMINMAVAYSAIGQEAAANQVLDRAIKLNPNHYDAWLNKGNVLLKGNQNEKALEAYRRANSINPWIGSAYFNIGNYYYKTNNMNEAIVWYRKAVEREPNMPLGYLFLARAYIKVQDYKNAYSSVKSGLRLDPSDKAGNQMLADLNAYFARNN
ncbi:MAG: tetratricopeptide repeat protein [Cyclobacteriaceae bacterium]|nr:tetratricopeptide repeat protein [Cyclobacteriaceae bacterium]MCB0500774.1 tetratricopeptide repeat protein [Cyclobacteriaceae bacterium]MCB9236691.1 tetratricopeptide repeat protein [Flammeovirgaceae bacterium]MCO5272612.1 tetratricopeptide repeat protein [Cyclobacteriaceae bacterium]MCW5901970.1 tetratricopeptide repeat protein [Cyclobacteriaceae bacterium]